MQKKDAVFSRQAKVTVITCMQAGQSWSEATVNLGVQVSRSTVYRLYKRVREHGEEALQDGRHGHPIKLRGEVRAFLEASCCQSPSTPSSTIQTTLQERFDLSVSISQINRVRAALGVSNHPKSRERGKKR